MSQINCIDGALANPGFQWVVSGANKPGFMHDAANSEIDFVINGVQSLVATATGIVLPNATDAEIADVAFPAVEGAWVYSSDGTDVRAHDGASWKTVTAS